MHIRRVCMCFYFIYVHFRLFPIFDLGLTLYASEPFKYLDAAELWTMLVLGVQEENGNTEVLS